MQKITEVICKEFNKRIDWEHTYWFRTAMKVKLSKKSLNWAQKVEMKLVDGMSVDLSSTWNK